MMLVTFVIYLERSSRVLVVVAMGVVMDGEKGGSCCEECEGG